MKEQLSPIYKSCVICPRQCKCDRLDNKIGFCGEGSRLRLSSACLHFGEEPLITVHGGSGTVFFTGCTLRCSFCQNYQISQKGMGSYITKDDFVKVCLALQDKGAENINLVTGSHHIPLIADYLTCAKDAGLKIPIAWNSSAYESVEMLELLKGLVDIWLPDLKTLNSLMSASLFKASDYPVIAKKAIRWMILNVPMNIISVNKDGIKKDKMLSGVIIRHLFLPGRLEDTVITLDWLKKHADGKACISLMSQYTPVPTLNVSGFENRLVSSEEDNDLRDLIDAYDFEYLFYQDLSDDTSWLPNFSLEQPFSYALARPVWHWEKGFREPRKTPFQKVFRGSCEL